MHTPITSSTHLTGESDTLKSLLREAKRLHRAALSESTSQALPVLRRLLASEVLRDISLPELRRKSNIIQRKHLLQLLALEAGFADWASFKRALSEQSATEASHYSLALRHAGYPNLWFSDLAQAQSYAKVHGGQALAVGAQAVVVPVR